MAAKKKTASRKKAATETAHPAFAVARVATHSLINMIVVTAACGTTLATLMTVLKFKFV
ncbi:hypothetical protein [Tardiphaga alba]|uniref:hypothetical protein n=1 Tax=Tardiphaga alba TaxID=340268 RepID=UPI001BA92ED7|nr:hypothetical protein [Tardiphaga alba]